MTNAQRTKFWFSSLDGRKNLVLVETNTGKACFFQAGFSEVFGAEACTGLWNLSFEEAFEMVINLPWGAAYNTKAPTRKQLDQLIKYYNK